jgi:hypothetical protein
MKIRSSAIGKIMTNPKTKGESLSQTTKTYLQELAVQKVYGIRKEFSSRYTDKGNEVEELSIALCNDVLGFRIHLQKRRPFYKRLDYRNSRRKHERNFTRCQVKLGRDNVPVFRYRTKK